MTVYRDVCLWRASAVFHDAVSSDGAAWCSRRSPTPTLAAKSLWLHGWKTKGLSSIDPGHTLSTSPCSSQSRCIKSYQVIRMQYTISCHAKPPNLQSRSSYRMQRHPGGYEVICRDWSRHEILQVLQVPKYESKHLKSNEVEVLMPGCWVMTW